MRVIKIGRSSRNDITINDANVSREHCQIVENNGYYSIVDLNSTNGTYVNGSRCHGQTRLNPTDIVRIGNTTLPWNQYFSTTVPGGIYNNNGGYVGNNGGYGGNNGGYVGNSGSNDTKETSVMGIFALLLALVGAGLAIWFAVSFFEFIGDYNDTKAILGKTLTDASVNFVDASLLFNNIVGIIAFCVNIAAVILASIADFVEENKDTTLATIANSIAGFAACAIGAMYIWYWAI